MAKSLDQLSEGLTHRILIYGPPKSGKTFCLGKLAESHIIHYLSLENGHKTFLNPACAAPEFRKNILVYSFMDTPEAPVAAVTLDYLFRHGEATFCEEHGKIGCASCKKAGKEFSYLNLNALTPKDILVIDSVTQWTASIDFSLNKDNPDKKFEFDDWRKEGLYLNRSLSRIQLLSNTNVVCISHESIIEDSKGDDKITPTAGTKNNSRNFARFFDGVYYTYVENKKHKMLTSSTGANNIISGDRLSFEVKDYPTPQDAMYALFNIKF